MTELGALRTGAVEMGLISLHFAEERQVGMAQFRLSCGSPGEQPSCNGVASHW